jgi:hypothetical protein
MGAINVPSATAKQEQAKAIGEAVRLLHRAGWHEYAKRIADDARDSGICVDDGKQLVQSSTVIQELRDCAEACRVFKEQRDEVPAYVQRLSITWRETADAAEERGALGEATAIREFADQLDRLYPGDERTAVSG